MKHSSLSFALAALLCLIPRTGMAQTPDGNPEQDPEFVKRRLSVEMVGRAEFSVNSSTWTGSGSSWNQWLAYEGFTRISEPEFFHRAGYEREALAAQRYHAAIQRQLHWGWGLAGVGLLLSGIGFAVSNSYDDAWEPGAAPWSVTGTAGIVMATTGALFCLGYNNRMNTNWAPASTVEGIADEYNRRLLEETKGGTKK